VILACQFDCYAAEVSLNSDHGLHIGTGSETKRALPIGFWKGSGLTIVLDMIAAALAGGQTTHEIQTQGAEYAVSQVRQVPISTQPATCGLGVKHDC
jgi:hypothetical protein